MPFAAIGWLAIVVGVTLLYVVWLSPSRVACRVLIPVALLCLLGGGALVVTEG